MKKFVPSVQVQVLSEKDIMQIHNAALEVLERVGVAINTAEGRKLLLDAGCKQGPADNVILIPPKLVENAIKTAPKSITLYDRLGNEACWLEGKYTNYGTGSDCPFILDRESGGKRFCTYDDVAGGAKVVDWLEHFNFVMPVGIISDRPRHIADVFEVDATIRNTTKPIVFTAHNKRTFQASVDIAAAVSGGLDKLQAKPTIGLYAEPTSPLRYMAEATDKLMLASQLRVPVVFTPCPLMGASAPATGAGILAQTNAECLSGLVIHQLVNPGAPFIYGGVENLLDMCTTIAPYGSPELHQLCAALTDVAHHYNLPMFGTCGCSDAKTVDAQAGLEVGFSTLMATLNGQNLIHDIGFLESALITSYEVYMLTDEAIGMAKHIARGVTVNRETLAVDVIAKVGQTGDFLTQEHTLTHFRDQFYFPKYLDRCNYAGWEANGRRPLGQALHDKVDDVLATHKAVPIEASVLKQIDEVLARVSG